MGEVYLVEDTKLDRQVALKLLPAEVVDNPQRRSRFMREAKALATLNHPNIVTVHSVEEADGVHFFTMELVRGKTLAALLPRQGVALGKFFDLAIPLVNALAAAHHHGITHRDLKPENVMVRDDGCVKVLDFGLAKGDRDVAAGADVAPANAATLSVDANFTQHGRVVGTPAYMSPEQAEGSAVDQRSDIFSLGILFYEMLCGDRPFTGTTTAATIGSILGDVPRSLSGRQPSVPRELARTVHRCLEKDPANRYQSVIDVRHALEDIKRDLDSDELRAAPRSTPRRWSLPAMALGAAAVASIAVAGWFALNPEPAAVDPVPALGNAIQITSTHAVETYPTWSPDGGRIAYEVRDGYVTASAWSQIWVAQLGGGDPVHLTADHPGNNRMPSWSPDGAQIAFFSDRGGEWGVDAVSAIGGTRRRLLSLPDLGAASSWSAPQWSSDGRRLFLSVTEKGENTLAVLELPSLQVRRERLPGRGSFIWDLALSPDDRRLAYVEGGGGATEITQLFTMPVNGGDRVALTDGRTLVWSPTWSRDSRTLFYVSNRGGSMDLWQQRMAEDGHPTGEPALLTPGLGVTSAVFSRDGTKLAYTRGGRVSNVWRIPVDLDKTATWADARQLTFEHAFIEFIDPSPDGQRLALSSNRRGNQDLYTLPIDGGEMTPLTTDPTPDWAPSWSPDGLEIAFYSYRSGNRDVWVMPSSGGPARQLTTKEGTDWMPEWSPDGLEIAYSSRADGDAIWVMPATGGEPRKVSEGGTSVTWSPDGQWLVVPKRGQLYRVELEGGDEVALGGSIGSRAHVTRDGRWIFYNVLAGPRETHDLYARSVVDGTIRRLTSLGDRPGRLGGGFAADDRYLYFTWLEDVGDLWVMEAARGGQP
jgi:eukaryotic-like serine/threonine-protein kinase